MVTGHQVIDQNIYLEDIEEFLKLISEIILKPSRYVLKKLKSLKSNKIEEFNGNKSQINYEKLIEKYHELEVEFNSNKINLYNEMNSLSSCLKEDELFYDEYFDFCEIQDIIKNTLDREFSLIKNSDFDYILELIIDFSKLIHYKIDLIKNNNFDMEKFESKYLDYLTNFTKSKNYYYENICNDDIDDELFMEYTNIIMG